MRNLKKFLALVLAMVMAFSLMLSASAATSLSGFQDADKVTPEFVESVTILAGLDVIKGDGDEDNKTIRPQDEITRAEAAALVYRIVTGDVNDRQVQLYSDYGKFADVNSGDWFAGYVGYCQNAGIIKGTTPTTFSPYLKVTGYEVLAMILRAVGYGKNNEFTGSSWQVNVASLGKTKHITDSVSSAQYNYTLNMNARREIVAELLFRGAMIPQVTWTAIGGYNERTTLLGNEAYNDSLAIEVFGLSRDGWRYGSWGRPELVWSADLNPTGSREVAVLPAAASHSFTDLKRECDVAEMLEITTSDTFVLFVDAAKRTATNPITIANDAVTDAYRIVATDTVTKVGGYGRLTEIYLQDDMDKQYPYYDYWTYWSTDEGSAPNGYQRTALADTFVMIDTYLAKVISTSDVVLDAAGHVITPARMVVDLYDRDQTATPLRRTISKAASSKDNWEYSAGDVLSLKGTSTQVNTAVPADQTNREAWAFTLPQVVAGTTINTTPVLVQNTHVFDITELEGKQGKQTTVYWNNGKHQVDGQDQTDALALRMDKAGSNIDTTFTWYYDNKDNGESYLLGIDDGGKVNYGVITSIYVAYGANESTDGVAKAVASVKYADGTTGTETIDYFLAHTRGTITDAMTEDATGANGANVAQLWPYYNLGNEYPMHAFEDAQPYNNNTSAPSPKRETTPGTVYMAPVAASNAQSANAGANGTNATLNVHGILNNNLWQFVKSAGDKTVAIEVAGGGTADYTAQSANDNSYEGHWAVTNGVGGKVYKNLSYVTNATGTTVAWLDNDTKIMLRNETSGAIACYDGVSALPGDVTISTTATGNARYNEIDWADTDNDGRADVLYVTGTIEGVTTYGLFYTNSLTSTWNGTTGTIHGFWNGEETDLTFASLELFNQVKNAYNNSADQYKGHLFAIKQIGGVVADVLVKSQTSFVEELLYNVGTGNTSGQSLAITTTNILSSAGHTSDWKYGNNNAAGSTPATDIYAGTNPYSADTAAVYWTDDATTPVTYNASSNWSLLGATVNANGTIYRLTPNSKVYGIGSNVVLAEGVTALEYLNHSVTNDVTIIHDNNSVIEMYIQTDPNITPSGVAGRATSPSGIYVNNVGGTPAALETAINSGVGNQVVYCTDSTTNNVAGHATLNGLGLNLGTSGVAPDTNHLDDYLFFPFTLVATGATPANATLVVKEGDVVVYTESATFNSGSAHRFVMNFAGNADNAAGVPNGRLTLKSGVTYTFEITARVLNGTAWTASSGSFTMR